MDYIKAIQAETVQIRERKIKKKARRWAILALLLLLIMFLFPWMSDQVMVKQQFDQVVHVQFEKDFMMEASSTEKSSAKASAAIEDSETETEVAEEAVEELVETEPEPVPETKPEPVPEPKPKTETVKITPTPTKPVITSSEANRKIDLKVEKLLKEVSEKAKVKKVSSQITEVTEEITDDFMSDLADYFKKNKKKKSKPGGGKKSDKPDTGTSANAGEGDSGKSNEGDADTDGNGDAGDSGDAPGDFDGDGLLTRKVIFRPNIDDLVKQTGRITVNLCVDRSGKVVFSEIDKDSSTITDRSILKKAEIAASKYRYEKDYTVAERQCGKLSFVVKIQK